MITVEPERGNARAVTVEVRVKRGGYAVFTLGGSVIVTVNCNGQVFDPVPGTHGE